MTPAGLPGEDSLFPGVFEFLLQIHDGQQAVRVNDDALPALFLKNTVRKERPEDLGHRDDVHIKMRRYLIVAEKLGQHKRRLFRGELQKQVAHARRHRQRGKHHGMREHIHKIERRSAHDRGPDLGVAPDLFQKNLGGEYQR